MMGITIHFNAVTNNEKKIDANTRFWLKEIPKMKKRLPKQFFPKPYSVFEVKRFDKIRDATPEEIRHGNLVNSKVGFTQEDMYNALNGSPISFYDATPEVVAKYGKPKPIKNRNYIGRTDYCKGVGINPYEGSETINFIFCRTPKAWAMRNFTKTQYGGIPAHLTVCKILEDTKKKFFPNMKIHDETDFCGKKTKDPEKLRKNFEESAIMIDKLTGLLRKAMPEGGKIVTGGEMAIREAKRLERVI